jgi:DNA-binding HxlR family transcriptional regulator
MTKRENYASIREIVEKLGRTDLVEFVDHEVELLNKKNNAPKNPTAKQLENEKLKDVILAEMGDKPLTITEMQTKISALSELSNQRVSAIVKQLVEDNSLVRTVEKRKAYFAKA